MPGMGPTSIIISQVSAEVRYKVTFIPYFIWPVSPLRPTLMTLILGAVHASDLLPTFYNDDLPASELLQICLYIRPLRKLTSSGGI